MPETCLETLLVRGVSHRTRGPLYIWAYIIWYPLQTAQSAKGDPVADADMCQTQPIKPRSRKAALLLMSAHVFEKLAGFLVSQNKGHTANATINLDDSAGWIIKYGVIDWRGGVGVVYFGFCLFFSEEWLHSGVLPNDVSVPVLWYQWPTGSTGSCSSDTGPPLGTSAGTDCKVVYICRRILCVRPKKTAKDCVSWQKKILKWCSGAVFFLFYCFLPGPNK